ncbi:MAG: site-specific recombinase, invertase Pin [Mucilaginibacter sp.]|nr:site-specific recombinase, invertase Pin [Mucilaginibacter sp.]
MNAIGYIRLSVRDQSRYSLEYQEESIREYCNRNNIELTAVFKDNGQSSYTFDRPDYIAVETFIKKHRGKNQYFIIMDHDRFSRNLSEALSKITELEIKHGIKVLATHEPVDIDPSDPNVFMQRAFRYLLANEELLRIRKRTRQGMRHAQESGRFVNRAPFGYTNAKDVANKSILVIDEPKAEIIQKIFKAYLSGEQAHVIYKDAASLGFTVKGNSAITKVLSNCLYAGLVRVVGDKNHPEHYVKGLHTAIVSEDDFWIVQEKLGNKRPSKVQAADKFPLRGILKCWCGLHMTAGFSKGKKRHYLYYRCIKHTSTNLPGTLLHEKFKQILAHLSFSPEQVAYLCNQVKTLLKSALKDRETQLASKTKEVEELRKKIESLEERFLNKEIEVDTYKRWYTKYSAEKAQVMQQLHGLNNSNKTKWERCNQLLPSLTSLADIYEKTTIKYKHLLIKAVFKHAITYSEDAFRTPSINDLFAGNYLKVKEKGLLFVEQPLVFSGSTPFCSP